MEGVIKENWMILEVSPTLSIMGVEENLDKILDKAKKAKGTQELIHGMRKIMANNIEEQIKVLSYFWELLNKNSTLKGIIQYLKGFFRRELQKDLDFINNMLGTFDKKLTRMSE